MKNNAVAVSDTNVVYRKDGTTPDLRYKKSREFVYAKYVAKNNGKDHDGKIRDFKYQHLRDHVVSNQLEHNMTNMVQIRPSGKKPIWKAL
jgi:hypothetical protein